MHVCSTETSVLFEKPWEYYKVFLTAKSSLKFNNILFDTSVQFDKSLNNTKWSITQIRSLKTRKRDWESGREAEKEEGRNGGMDKGKKGTKCRKKRRGRWTRVKKGCKRLRVSDWRQVKEMRKYGKWLKFLRKEIESRREIWIWSRTQGNKGREQAEENWSNC